jgi:hypothetical protein
MQKQILPEVSIYTELSSYLVLGVIYSLAGVRTGLQDGQSGVQVPAEARDFLSCQKCTDQLCVPASLLFKGTGVLPQRYSSKGIS